MKLDYFTYPSNVWLYFLLGTELIPSERSESMVSWYMFYFIFHVEVLCYPLLNIWIEKGKNKENQMDLVSLVDLTLDPYILCAMRRGPTYAAFK